MRTAPHRSSRRRDISSFGFTSTPPNPRKRSSKDSQSRLSKTYTTGLTACSYEMPSTAKILNASPPIREQECVTSVRRACRWVGAAG